MPITISTLEGESTCTLPLVEARMFYPQLHRQLGIPEHVNFELIDLSGVRLNPRHVGRLEDGTSLKVIFTDHADLETLERAGLHVSIWSYFYAGQTEIDSLLRLGVGLGECTYYTQLQLPGGPGYEDFERLDSRMRETAFSANANPLLRINEEVSERIIGYAVDRLYFDRVYERIIMNFFDSEYFWYSVQPKQLTVLSEHLTYLNGKWFFGENEVRRLYVSDILLKASDDTCRGFLKEAYCCGDEASVVMLGGVYLDAKRRSGLESLEVYCARPRKRSRSV